MREAHAVTRTSMLSGITRTITITFDVEDYKAWDNGSKLIQDAFPYLTSGEREFIKTGITDEEWDEAFG